MSKSPSKERSVALMKTKHGVRVQIKKTTGKWPTKKEIELFAIGFNLGWKKSKARAEFKQKSGLSKISDFFKAIFKTKPRSEASIRALQADEIYRVKRKCYQHPEPLPGERPQQLKQPLYKGVYLDSDDVPMSENSKAPLSDIPVNTLIKCKKFCYQKLGERYICPFCKNKVKLK